MENKLELTVLGSGSYAPWPAPSKKIIPGYARNPSGYAVKIGEEALIFDLGSGNLRNLAKAGFKISDISHVFLTHFHIDHFIDLLSLLFLFHYDFAPKNKKLTIAGPKGIKRLLKKLAEAFNPYLNPEGYKLNIIELSETKQLRGKNWTLRAKNAVHSKPALAYRLDCGRKSITYTGDCFYDDSLAGFAKKSSVLIADCTWYNFQPKPVHMTFEQALKLARLSNSEKTLLSHISPQAEPHLAGKRAGLPASVIIARDLLRIKI